VIAVGPGQAGDAPALLPLLTQLRVSRALGRPRTRPDRLRADKAYSSRAIRVHLRERGITAVIPEPDDRIANRKRRGSCGGRPPAFDATDYRNRNVVERRFCHLKQWRALATRYDKLAIVYRAAAVLNAVIAWTKNLSDMPWATTAASEGVAGQQSVVGSDDYGEPPTRAIYGKELVVTVYAENPGEIVGFLRSGLG
jgi:transposase